MISRASWSAHKWVSILSFIVHAYSFHVPRSNRRPWLCLKECLCYVKAAVDGLSGARLAGVIFARFVRRVWHHACDSLVSLAPINEPDVGDQFWFPTVEALVLGEPENYVL